MKREEKVRILLAEQELERRKASAPLIYYRPHEGQKRFHDAILIKRVTICTSGNRFGKSFCNAAEIVAWLYGYRPWEVPGIELDPHNGDYPRRQDIPPEYWLRRPDNVPIQLPAEGLACTGLDLMKGIARILFPYIEAFLPPAVRQHPDYKVARGSQSIPLYMRLPASMNTGGSTLYFAAGSQDTIAFEGNKYTFATFDEPPKRPVFSATWRGLTDFYGRCWFSMTPIGPNAPWVFQEFIASGREDCVNIMGSIHDNPYIGHREKQEFLDGGGFTDEERQAREAGAWSFLSHRAFPQFDPAVHIIPARQISTEWIRGLAIDPAHRRPYALLWCAFGPRGEVEVYREWPRVDHAELRTSEYVVRDYVEIIHRLELGERIDFRCLDPRFGAAAPRIKGERHTSIQEDFAANGMYFDCRMEGTEREETGIEMIRGLLRYDRRSPLSPLNCPKLRVHSHCLNTINALGMSNFKAAPLSDPDRLEEKVLEKYKDFRDCLRYAILYPKMDPGLFTEDYGYLSEKDLKEWNSEESDWW